MQSSVHYSCVALYTPPQHTHTGLFLKKHGHKSFKKIRKLTSSRSGGAHHPTGTAEVDGCSQSTVPGWKQVIYQLAAPTLGRPNHSTTTAAVVCGRGLQSNKKLIVKMLQRERGLL